MHEQGQVSA